MQKNLNKEARVHPFFVWVWGRTITTPTIQTLSFHDFHANCFSFLGEKHPSEKWVDLGSKIHGAKAGCKALSEDYERRGVCNESFISCFFHFATMQTSQKTPAPSIALFQCHWRDRRNKYNGEMEYWVVTKETGKRTDQASYEEENRKRQKAWSCLGYVLQLHDWISIQKEVVDDKFPTPAIGLNFCQVHPGRNYVQVWTHMFFKETVLSVGWFTDVCVSKLWRSHPLYIPTTLLDQRQPKESAYSVDG